MFDIFHQASTYYNVTSSDRADFCSMVDNVRVDAEVKVEKNNNGWEDAMRGAFNEGKVKIEWTDTCENVEDFINIIKSTKNKQTAERDFDGMHFQPIREVKDVRSKLVEGPKSVIKLLPIPHVNVESVLDPAVGGKQRQFAHIDADQLINHALAYNDNKINYYRAGYEEDWDPDSDSYRNDHLRRTFLRSKKCREIHERVKRLVQEGQISKEARIVFMRSWSDAFGAHAITANNEFNSIQVFTIRFKGETDFILPHALLFKKWNSKDMIIELLSEIKQLEMAKTRYWSIDKKAVETLVFTELVSNDLPERNYNLSLSNNGKYHKWYGHSCLFNADTTPSCENCWNSRVAIILGDDYDNQTVPECCECHDWWSNNVERADVRYPIRPGYTILNMPDQDIPAVSLTLPAMCTSLHELAEWYAEQMTAKADITLMKNVVKKYVRLICLAEPENMEEMIFDEYKDITMSNNYPPMFKEFPRLEVEISLFPSVVMHMFFLGVAKGLIKQSNRLKVIGNQRRDVKAWWNSFHSLILSQQKSIKGLSLSWCYPMSFSATDGKADGDDNEKKKGSNQGKFFTTGWMSSHYVDFTRISLFQYSALDEKICQPPRGFEEVIPAFRRLFVLWFCLCANAFGPPDETTSLRVDHLVRLFLSCCVEFHRVGKQMNTKSGDPKRPFFTTASNFFSLLNCKELIDVFGSLRYLWEGLDEHFIQLLKREIKTLRHNTQSLKNLLDKMLRTMVLKNLNSDNPNVYKNPYTRTSEFKTYSKGAEIQTAQDVLKCQFISGVVIDCKFYIAFRVSERAYLLHKLKFSDDDGEWFLNLWYSKVEIEGPMHEFIGLTAKAEIQELSQDQFLLLRRGNDHNFGTIICHSWRVRMSDGSIKLPMPREEILNSE